MSKQTKKVRETFATRVWSTVPGRCELQDYDLDSFKWNDGDRVRVTVERIERPQRKGRRRG